MAFSLHQLYHITSNVLLRFSAVMGCCVHYQMSTSTDAPHFLVYESFFFHWEVALKQISALPRTCTLIFIHEGNEMSFFSCHNEVKMLSRQSFLSGSPSFIFTPCSASSRLLTQTHTHLCALYRAERAHAQSRLPASPSFLEEIKVLPRLCEYINQLYLFIYFSICLEAFNQKRKVL